MRFTSFLKRSLGALALLASLGASTAVAQSPITLVVPYAPGGATDTLARILGQGLAEELGRSVVIENRAGGGTIVGAQAVARAQPDGNTLLMATSTTLAINRSLYKSLPYDPSAFTPVGMIAEVPLVIVVSSSVKAGSLQELVALAKADPDALSFGSAGNGSPQHLAGELFKSQAGVNLTHIPYKGSAAALNDVLGGQIHMMFADLAPALPQIESGRLRALAVTSAQRLPSLPDVPTVRESGVEGAADYVAVAWQSLVAAPGTSQDVATTYNAALGKVLGNPAVRQRFQDSGVSVRTSTPEELGSYIESESARWAEIVKASGATVD